VQSTRTLLADVEEGGELRGCGMGTLPSGICSRSAVGGCGAGETVTRSVSISELKLSMLAGSHTLCCTFDVFACEMKCTWFHQHMPAIERHTPPAPRKGGAMLDTANPLVQVRTCQQHTHSTASAKWMEWCSDGVADQRAKKSSRGMSIQPRCVTSVSDKPSPVRAAPLCAPPGSICICKRSRRRCNPPCSRISQPHAQAVSVQRPTPRRSRPVRKIRCKKRRHHQGMLCAPLGIGCRHRGARRVCAAGRDFRTRGACAPGLSGSLERCSCW
jgi:hypothetical protein